MWHIRDAVMLHTVTCWHFTPIEFTLPYTIILEDKLSIMS